jgi:two-component system phosphate regulon sensor histidine kinase PhoR
LFAGIATVGLGLLILGESLGWLATHPVTFGGEAVNLTERPGHLSVIWMFFAASVCVTAALTTAIVSRLRQQERNLMNERSRFMLQVAHNIRAPLAASLSMLDVLRGGYLGEVADEQSEYLERMDQRLETLNVAVGELLDLAKSRQGVEELERRPVRSELLAEGIERTFSDESKRKGLALRVTVSEGLPEIAGDAVRLEQMLENLASNAIKYTAEGGRVEITFKSGEDDDRPIAIEVQDTGIGIPEEEQHQLFSEFFRAENAREVEEIGTGLGLAIVKRIVDLHQGRIRVQSQKGSGTTFIIDLPGCREKT